MRRLIVNWSFDAVQFRENCFCVGFIFREPVPVWAGQQGRFPAVQQELDSFRRVGRALKTVLPNADFVIEGYVDPRGPLRDEGPFGDRGKVRIPICERNRLTSK